MNTTDRKHQSITAAIVTLAVGLAGASPVTVTASGPDAASITASVDTFRSLISEGGGLNAPNTGPFTNGRREINWDAPALDAFQSPGLMPANFFNANNKRGATFSTPDGSGFLVSQRVADANGRFGDIDPSYNASFQAFSPLRLFAVRGGVTTDTFFSIPTTPAQSATVNGFGAIFTDVDATDSTFLEFYGLGGALLRRTLVPASPSGLSFAGVYFADGERIERVRVVSGNTPMGLGVLDGDGRDVVAMDDFFYGEPLAVPSPAGAAVLCGAGLISMRRRR
ncbi:MAG: hypothetical protein JSR77_18015 [Planctomycetes bacterium]|nr:hypothetical protein [Planctomycetota bacterium]